MSDFVLTAGIDFREAGQQVDTFVKDTTTKMRSLADIKAKAAAPGGSMAGRSGSADSAYQRLLANERALQAAMTRTESMAQRIGRQMNGNSAMTDRARNALGQYANQIGTFGTRSLEGARAQGEFARQMGTLNHEIAAANGLLVNLNRGFGSVVGAVGAVSPAMGGAGRDVLSLSNGLKAAATGAGAVLGVVGGVAVGFAALGAAALTAGAAMAGPVDAMNLLVGKLNSATGDMGQAKAMYAETVTIANRLGVAVNDVGTAMVRFTGVGKDIGLTNSDVAGLTETFVKLGRVSGQTGQEAASSLTQLSQALAAGRLQGDEFRSLSENMPALTRAIGSAMGVTTGELKNLSSQGIITTDIVLKALRGMTAKVNADFETIPRTVEQLNANISNQWDQLMVNLDGKLHLSDMYKFFLGLPERALQAANNMLAGPKPTDRAADVQDQITQLDSQISRTPFSGFILKGLQNQRAELARELDGLRTDMVRAAVDAGEETRQADERAWQQRGDTARKGVDELKMQNDAVYKANQDYASAVKKLDQAKTFVDPSTYKEVLQAITNTRDAAIERATATTTVLTSEERAIFNVESKYSALRMELANIQVATKAMSMGDMTILDEKALQRTVDFLTSFAKQAKIIPTSLEDLAQRAGVSLGDLQEGFRAVEGELLKLNALKKSKDLGIETEEQKRLTDATLQGAEAYARVSREIEVERQLRQLGLDARDKDLDKTREEIRLKLQALEASKQAAQAASEAQSMLSQYGDGDTQLRLRLEKLEQTRKVLQDGGKWTPELQTAFDKASIDITKQTDTIQGAFYRTFDNIGQRFGDIFDKMLDGGQIRFSDFTKVIEKEFLKAFASMAATPVCPPIKQNFLGHLK